MDATQKYKEINHSYNVYLRYMTRLNDHGNRSFRFCFCGCWVILLGVCSYMKLTVPREGKMTLTQVFPLTHAETRTFIRH